MELWLRPALLDEFALDGTSVMLRFTRNAAREVAGFILDAGRTRGMVFTRDAAAEK